MIYSYYPRHPKPFVKRYFLLILLLISLLLTSFFWESTHAQDITGIKIDALEVQLLPEYNPSSMLVIWSISLAKDTSHPKELMFKLPVDAQIRSISHSESNGEQNPIKVEGGAIMIGRWQNIRFTTSSSDIKIEYYDPNLIKEGEQRKFEFHWFSSYPVASISVKIYQPFGVREITTTPSFNTLMDETAQMRTYYGEFGSVPTDEDFSLNLEYVANKNNLSYPTLDVFPAIPVDKTTAGHSASPLSVILWLFAVAAFVLIVVGLYYWWFRINILAKRERTLQGVGITNLENQLAFCHECGMRSEADDSYCRNCGATLHRTIRRNDSSRS